MSATRELESRIFNVARKLPVKERAFYLDGACAGDTVLRREVEELLEANDAAGAFLHELATEGENPPKPGVLPAPAKTLREEHSPSAQPGDTICRYKLLEKIGEGGFGVVYVAEQREPVKRRVALKVIKLGMDTKQVVARFEAERQALALMDHPNIAKVLDAGATEDGRPFFVMELVKGIPITKYCDQEKLGIRERLDLFIKVCHAIQHAHQKGIIHRDIKPSNILVTLHDGVPVPKVIDFGIAKATQAELTEKTVYTQFQQFIGTPAYMSPEQAEMSGLDIDTRSDIYSLGVLLYELLTGSTPFDTKELLKSGLDEMRKIIREREPVRPSTRLSQTRAAQPASSGESALRTPHSAIDTDLDWIVMKCLEKDRTRRYETANGVAQDIERHLKHEPVLARPPSMGYRLQKSVRRNKLAFTAAGAVGSALVLGVVVSSWQAFRATEAGRREAVARLRADEAARVAESQRERAEKGELRAKDSELVARQNLYASDMLLAQQAREDGNLGLALNLLKRHQPSAGEADIRGWEWRHLWSLCQSDEVATIATNAALVSHLAISPDGSLLSTAGWGSLRAAVKVRDFPSGRLIATPETSDAGGAVAFSPNGKLLAFTTMGHGLKLWNIEAHEEVANLPGTYAVDRGSGLAFSPDGGILAAATSAKAQILLWDIAKKTLCMTLKGSEASSLVFSPDGRTLISGNYDNTIRLWSLANGQEIACLTNHTSRVHALALSADGRTLASAGSDKTIRIWDVNERRQLAILTNHTRWVTSLAFSPDQKTLASGSADFLIKLWDTAQWREASTLKGSLDEVLALAFSPDGKALVSGTKDGLVKTWEPLPNVRPPDVQEWPPDAWWWSLGQKTLCCIHTNWSISYWDPAALRQTALYEAPQEVRTNSLCFNLTPAGRMVWANKQSEVVIWDLLARRQLGRVPWVGGEEKFVAISPEEKLLVAAAAGKCLTVWDLETMREIASLPKSAGNVTVACLSQDLCLLAAGGEDGVLEVWNLGRKKRVAEWEAHLGFISGVAFMPDGKRLVTVGQDGTAKLWEIETRRQLSSFPRTLNAFISLAISPDGQRIAAGEAEGRIRIWIAATGQEIAALRGGHGGVLGSLRFVGPAGNTLVSVTSKEVRLWRAPPWEEIAAKEKKTERKAQ